MIINPDIVADISAATLPNVEHSKPPLVVFLAQANLLTDFDLKDCPCLEL
jgi:hypothetical protein